MYANMRSPDVTFIILLATLFAFAIRDSNGNYFDPTYIWTLLKQAASNGNQLVSNWFQNAFCSSNENIDMNGTPPIDMNTETGVPILQDGQD